LTEQQREGKVDLHGEESIWEEPTPARWRRVVGATLKEAEPLT
jgi:hypothetical protein